MTRRWFDIGAQLFGNCWRSIAPAAIAAVFVLGLVGASPAAQAAPLTYQLDPVQIAKGTWVLFGENSGLSQDNGGFIANTVIIEVPAGVVVISSGPSRRFGEALLQTIKKLAPLRKVIRVFNTHHHPDHVFGNQVFGAEMVAATPKVIEAFRLEGEGLSDNMYRLVGDWMRGTRVTIPSIALTAASETIGGRQFSYFYFDGHTVSDLVIRDDVTGIVFAGDLVFHGRAPATPHADLARWRLSLDQLAALKPAVIVPGHGPVDAQGVSIRQTQAYLGWLDNTLRAAVTGGLTMNEAMQAPIPDRFASLAFVQEEFRRSVVHLYQQLEDELFKPVQVQR